MQQNRFPVRMISLIVSTSLLGLSLSSQAATDTGAPITKADLTTPVTSFPTDLVAGANQTQFANYAWRLLIAATQQTTATLQSGAGRAVGDGKHNFINTGATPTISNPLVFESFYHRTEAFPYYASTKPASPINQVPTYRTFYTVPGGVTPVSSTACPLPSTTLPTVGCTFTGQNYVNLDETNQISQNSLYFKNSNAPDFPVLYMAKVNATEASYALDSARQKPSSQVSWDFPNGVVEVKTAWRRVRDIKNSNPNTYHQATGTYYTADASGLPVPQQDTLALIAIHVIQKTANYQQFIFTTFEHVDAVTRNGSNAITDPAYVTAYNNLSYQTPDQSPHTATANGAYSINRTGQPAQQNKLTTYTLPAKGAISQSPTTLVQPNTIVKEVNDVNNQVNALVQSIDPNNVWANYRLKGVQAVPTSDTTAANYYLANIVVESSQPGIQLFSGILLNGGVPLQGVQSPNNLYFVNCRGDKGASSCVYPEASLNPSPLPSTYNNVSLNVQQSLPVPPAQFSMGGCQGCHGAAQQLGRDFSFLANGVLGVGKEIDTVPAASLTAAQKAVHVQRMAKKSKF